MIKHKPFYLHKPGMVCSLGKTTEQIASELFSADKNFLVTSERYSPGKSVPLGMVDDPLPEIESADNKLHSRNNQIILAALAQIQAQIDRHLSVFPAHRIGVVLGSSTSGIAEAESAIEALHKQGDLPTGYDYAQQEIGAPSEFIARQLHLTGPVQTISTACSSGAKALASARRLLALDICDAVICGGADSLCHLTVNGFMALESVSDEPCVPFKAERKGINIGEGACLFVMSSLEPEGPHKVTLAGAGETSDAHHISAPDPTADGALRAMQRALEEAELSPSDIGYINLHGTATRQNDQMESLAVHTLFGSATPCSSTKALTGHTLGAAGALEAGFCWLTLNQPEDHVLLPPQMGDGDLDSELSPISLVNQGERSASPLHYALSNSFAFGGNNIALVLGVNE
ncbi:3-oxoacyl-[acyl-carrier-protein] synthase 2 [Thalassocella blandensis]|nr:3-oxoacyl-[acyl-carrier-protein] synthase 2 [Thalassocella blandensis]